MGNSAFELPTPPNNGDNVSTQLSPSQMRSLIRAGLSPDLAFLPYQMPRLTENITLPRAPQRKNISVTNPANLQKETIEGKVEHGKLRLSFEVDSLAPCQITVFYMVTEVFNEMNVTVKMQTDPTLPPYVCEVKAGSAQHIEVPLSASPFLESLEQAFSTNAGSSHFVPLVILLSKQANTSLPTNAFEGVVQNQYSYFSFTSKDVTSVLQAGGGSLAIKFLRQTIHMNGRRYQIQDIYGMGDMSSIQECVICMSAKSDTAIFPCRHLCLCHDCAGMLRTQTNRCPICRTHVESLLQLEMLSDTAGKSE